MDAPPWPRQAPTDSAKSFDRWVPGRGDPNAAHITTWDNPEAMTAAVRAHLRAADSAAASKGR